MVVVAVASTYRMVAGLALVMVGGKARLLLLLLPLRMRMRDLLLLLPRARRLGLLRLRKL